MGASIVQMPLGRRRLARRRFVARIIAVRREPVGPATALRSAGIPTQMRARVTYLA
jgi:hypothetical protein